MNQGIETIYKGVLFRSKLETRWAAYFDLCGLEWQYEACPVRVFDGQREQSYLPDFSVRGILVEVKPSNMYENTKVILEAAQKGAINRMPKHVAALLMAERCDSQFIIVFGEPGACKYLVNKLGGAGTIFPQLANGGTQ